MQKSRFSEAQIIGMIKAGTLDAVSAKYGYFCPDVGFLSKARSELIATQPNLSTFAAQIADDLNRQRLWTGT